LLLQELTSHVSLAESLSSEMSGAPNLRPLDSKDVEIVSEYAYALKCAFADVFSVELHDAQAENALSLSEQGKHPVCTHGDI